MTFVSSDRISPVGKHHRIAAHVQPGRHDPAGIRGFARARRRVHRHDDPPEIGHLADPRLAKHRPRPQRVVAILDQLAFQLLPADPRPVVAPLQRFDEALDAKFFALSAVLSLTVSTVGSATSRLASLVGRGVVVMICIGRSPSRSPNCSMS